MSRPLRIPRPETPLHLYRHILRESSYLPPFARSIVDGRIRARFRRHQRDECAKTAIRRGNHELRALRAAVAGDLPRMYRLMFECFGRNGWRRRELMDELVRKDAPSDSDELEKYAEEKHAALASPPQHRPDWLDHWDVDKVMAFARSQVNCCEQNNRPGQELTGKHLVLEHPQTPKTDIFGRPLPKNRVRANLRRAWKKIAERILPPLPPAEWDMLRDLASGKGIDPKWAYTHRRALAKSASGVEGDPQPWKWEVYVVRPVALVDHQVSKKNKLLSGALDDSSPNGDLEPLNCHRWTPQLWKRMLAQIWRLSAKMEKKPDGKGWDIVWGKDTFKPPVANAATMEFLQGYVPPPMDKRKKAAQAARNGPPTQPQPIT
ncbi:hypothetical protein B0T16DRAFT_334005 [Cercophora newfieldiana]|uniref:Complex 1 LYR protein domain-containing protein n=1 Tax=Cercophora newfieldiana TaxID=92897 RepID=A0AA39XXP0_9PEZI|nr:hypothetical protein B0T16DRAFT_334005 [Cercophora newfieldiana]